MSSLFLRRALVASVSIVNGISHSLLFFGNVHGNHVAIFRDADDAEKLWLYEFELVVEDPWWGGTMANPDNPIKKISEISSEKLKKAELFCTNATSARLLYFVVEGQVYAYDIDNKEFEEIIGTIAGDDTIMIIIREGYTRTEVKNALSLVIPNINR